MKTPLRIGLSELGGGIHTFTAQFAGINDGKAILVGVRTKKGRGVADHLFVASTQQMEELHLNTGELIKFQASITHYTKRTDRNEQYSNYGLSRPIDVKRNLKGDKPYGVRIPTHRV